MVSPDVCGHGLGALLGAGADAVCWSGHDSDGQPSSAVRGLLSYPLPPATACRVVSWCQDLVAMDGRLSVVTSTRKGDRTLVR